MGLTFIKSGRCQSRNILTQVGISIRTMCVAGCFAFRDGLIRLSTLKRGRGETTLIVTQC